MTSSQVISYLFLQETENRSLLHRSSVEVMKTKWVRGVQLIFQCLVEEKNSELYLENNQIVCEVFRTLPVYEAITLKSNKEATEYLVSFSRTKNYLPIFERFGDFLLHHVLAESKFANAFRGSNYGMGCIFQRDPESPNLPRCNYATELQLPNTWHFCSFFQCSGYHKSHKSDGKNSWNNNFNFSDVLQTFQNIKSKTFGTKHRNSSLLWFLLIELETGIRIAKAREFLSLKSYQPKKTSCWSFLRFSRHQVS